jgi:hypothetical protein
MEDTRRQALVEQLEDIAKTGGGDTVQAVKTIAGALAEALGPSDHERAVARLQHGSKTPTAKETKPADDVEGLAARGREVDQEQLEDARRLREDMSAQRTVEEEVQAAAREGLEDQGKQSESASS